MLLARFLLFVLMRSLLLAEGYLVRVVEGLRCL